MVNEVADPAAAQSCTSVGQAQFCLYPRFSRDLSSLEVPVDGVLAHLTVRPDGPLTIRQVVWLSLPDPALTHGHPDREVSQWNEQAQKAPGIVGVAPASAIYLQVGSWPAAGGQLADAHFDLALATAEWGVGLPGTGGTVSNTGGFLQCVPFDQAREAVAIWLAILTTRPPVGELEDGLGTGREVQGANIGRTFVRTWNYPGSGAGGLTPPGSGVQNTAAGYLLADAMMSLPEQQVSRVLTDAWGRWLNWRTTDAQLAAALGLPMPSASSGATLPSGKMAAPAPGNGPQAPLCTT